MLLWAAVSGGDTPLPAPSDPGIGDWLWTIVAISVAAIPISLSLWALLDAARRPRWAWALADRAQVVWMALILFGTLSIVFGPIISGWYLIRVRPAIERAEAGLA